MTGLRTDVATFLPDGRKISFSGAEPGRGVRLWVQGVEEDKPRAISPEGYRMLWSGCSPDGSVAVVTGPDQRFYFYPLAGGEPTPIPGLVAGDIPFSFSADGRSLLVRRRGEVPARVMLLDIGSGKKHLWKELMPPTRRES